MVESQWGDGFGVVSCELAHLGLDACSAIGTAAGKTVVRRFMDVVQAFASIVVALTLPFLERSDDAIKLLEESGFFEATIVDILRDNVGCSECDNAALHMQGIVAASE